MSLVYTYTPVSLIFKTGCQCFVFQFFQWGTWYTWRKIYFVVFAMPRFSCVIFFPFQFLPWGTWYTWRRFFCVVLSMPRRIMFGGALFLGCYACWFHLQTSFHLQICLWCTCRVVKDSSGSTCLKNRSVAPWLFPATIWHPQVHSTFKIHHNTLRLWYKHPT